MMIFQSTLPCGSDCMMTKLCCSIIRFQSTLPCGSDRVYFTEYIITKISIHAPLRERPRPSGHCQSSAHFNPRSLAGATELFKKIFTSQHLFQSTLPCGSDTNLVLQRNNALVFQSTLPCGSDRN